MFCCCAGFTNDPLASTGGTRTGLVFEHEVRTGFVRLPGIVSRKRVLCAPHEQDRDTLPNTAREARSDEVGVRLRDAIEEAEVVVPPVESARLFQQEAHLRKKLKRESLEAVGLLDGVRQAPA